MPGQVIPLVHRQVLRSDLVERGFCSLRGDTLPFLDQLCGYLSTERSGGIRQHPTTVQLLRLEVVAQLDDRPERVARAYSAVELPMLRDPSKFANWLYRITTTTALAQLRRRRFTVSLDSPGLDEPRSAEPTLTESAERADKAREVREALAVLPEPDRLAVILHYVDGYSHEEIGSILGTSVSAVKSRVHRARRRVREEMLSMVEKSLKESVLEQLTLQRLSYSVCWGYYTREYADVLQIKITEVFGSSSAVVPGANYLVCGEYTLTGPDTIALRLAALGTSTGYEAFLTPGSGRFELYCHVQEVVPLRQTVLDILMPDDKALVRIQLE